jgi:hypothetical protein
MLSKECRESMLQESLALAGLEEALTAHCVVAVPARLAVL